MKKFEHVELLMRMVDEKYVNMQVHPTLPLKIYNYSQSCQFEKMWNDVTSQCRGLILDDDFNVVARPLKKFFNVEEVGIDEINEKMSSMSHNIFSKEDGSLGILYEYNGEYGISTRGSFASDQAKWATKYIKDIHGNELENLDTLNYTYLFEIIYPANRIVIDYHGESKLVAITKVNKSTGVSIWDFMKFEKEMLLLSFDIVKQLPMHTYFDYEHLKNLNLPNEEGYVLHFSDDYRVKIKFEDYVRIHRVVTNVTVRAIWDILRNDGDIRELLEHVPDEFFVWIKNKAEELTKEHTRMVETSVEVYDGVLRLLDDDFTQKDFALKVKEVVVPDKHGLMFSLRMGKDVSQQVWGTLRPEHEKPFETAQVYEK